MRRGFLVVVLLASPVPAAGAQEAETLADLRGRPEYRVLRDAGSFRGASVGDGGECSVGVLALRLVVASPAAREALLALLDEATLPGQLYALCGLWGVDPEAFAERVGPYLAREEPVEFLPSGCSVSREPAGRIVRRRHAPRLEGLEDSVASWRARTGFPADASAPLDIVGGGFAVVFGLDRPFGPRAELLETLPPDERRPEPWIARLVAGTESAPPSGRNPARVLGWFGPDVLDAVAPLVEQRDVRARRVGAQLLGWRLGVEVFGPRSRQAARLLARLLDDPDSGVRLEAAEGLAELGPWAEPALERVAARLHACPASFPEEPARGSAAAREEALVDQLLRVIGRCDPPTMPHLRPLLRGANPHVREGAAEACSERGRAAAAATPELVAALADVSPHVRAYALAALGRIGLSDPAIAARVAACVSDPRVAEEAVDCLGASSGAARPTALTALDRVPPSAPLAVRARAAAARWRLSPDEPLPARLVLDYVARAGRVPSCFSALLDAARTDAAVVAALVDGLARPDQTPRRAIELLAELGPPAAAAAPALEALALDPRRPRPLRLEAADALFDVAGDAGPAVALHLAVLRGPSADPPERDLPRRHAAHGLGRYGQAALPARDDLVRCLESPDATVCGWAAQALGAMGPEAAPAIPALLAALRRDDHGVRAAIQALGRIGVGSRDVLDALARVAADEGVYGAYRLLAGDTLEELR